MALQTTQTQEDYVQTSYLIQPLPSGSLPATESSSDISMQYQEQINVLKNQIIDLRFQIQELKDKRTTLVQNLRSSSLRSKQALCITIEYEDDVFVAYSDDLNLYGYGETEQNAIRDFCKEVESLYFDLKESKNKAGKAMQEVWSFLQDTIKEK